MQRAHERLREALHLSRTAARQSKTAGHRDLLLYCRGFCAALDGHHRGEDRTLFPAIEDAHPHLRPVLRNLTQDHSMIAHLLVGLASTLDSAPLADELDRHLEGIAAVMENHFRYEERQLLRVLDSLELDAPTTDALGPL